MQHAGDFVAIQAVPSRVESQSSNIFNFQAPVPITPFQLGHFAAADRTLTIVEQSESFIHGYSSQGSRASIAEDNPIAERPTGEQQKVSSVSGGRLSGRFAAKSPLFALASHRLGRKDQTAGLAAAAI